MRRGDREDSSVLEETGRGGGKRQRTGEGVRRRGMNMEMGRVGVQKWRGEIEKVERAGRRSGD